MARRKIPPKKEEKKLFLFKHDNTVSGGIVAVPAKDWAKAEAIFKVKHPSLLEWKRFIHLEKDGLLWLREIDKSLQGYNES